jgi:predicted GNAT family acetyltransferase
MFTKRAHRKKGYGKIILAHCSKLILEKNETVYVMTDRDKIESNIVCEAVGFKPYYNHVMTKINCT